ncbi:hypothetical protein [Xenococcus sp. PCC 7305]|uniref:hypothetical protein n=1 Tax=Xenococcus sp. PCC 7305 TaxID=102125 RepID=UPI0002ECF00D|nr:hypothetical protein [Xenococcus sp. PCC 7305]
MSGKYAKLFKFAATSFFATLIAGVSTIQPLINQDYQAQAQSNTPRLWGIDEDDGQLFSFEDYLTFTGFTNYGELKWDNNGSIEAIGEDIEAMTLDEDGTMYMALDRILGVPDNGEYCATLMSFKIQNALEARTGNNTVSILGAIQIPCDSYKDNVSGISIDPLTGDLIALLKDYNNGNQSVHDKLYRISKFDGSVVDLDNNGDPQAIGTIQGLGEQSRRAEDLEHAPDGRLFVTDNDDDKTYEVDRNTGEIIAVIDQSQEDGLGLSSGDTVKFEALGWDFGNNILVGNDDDNEVIAQLTLQDGQNQSYGDTDDMGLTDVEGIDFVPTPDGEPIDSTVATPFSD